MLKKIFFFKFFFFSLLFPPPGGGGGMETSPFFPSPASYASDSHISFYMIKFIIKFPFPPPACVCRGIER